MSSSHWLWSMNIWSGIIASVINKIRFEGIDSARRSFHIGNFVPSWQLISICPITKPPSRRGQERFKRTGLKRTDEFLETRGQKLSSSRNGKTDNVRSMLANFVSFSFFPTISRNDISPWCDFLLRSTVDGHVD